MRDPIIGIDLGTSNTVVAHVDATGKPIVLPDDQGTKIHPSVVSFHPNGGVVVGAAAKQRRVIDPQNTIYSVKRLIGRGFKSPEVQTTITRSPFRIKEGDSGAPLIVTRAGDFAVPEISAIILDYVRNIASERLASVSVNRAVVTVPASFNDAQRSATATAGAIANLDVVRVLNEPTAAALAYGDTRDLREIIAVYDFGGGTFDITILKLEDQVYEVLGTAGDTFLGGDDLDERIVDKMVAKFLAENRLDLRDNEVAMMRLRAVAEQTKIELSRRSRAVVRIDEIAYGARGKPLNLNIEITRDEFVSQVADIIDRTFPVCQEALALAGIGIDQIADVILVGGTTKIPYVRDQVARFFAKAPRTDVNPEDAVALGAALQAGALERELDRAASTSPALGFAGEDDTSDSATNVANLAELSAPTQAPSELATDAPRPKRATEGYTTKPDTSYAVTRPGARDDVFGRDTPSTPSAAVPLARLTKTIQPSQLPPEAKQPVSLRTTVPGVVPPKPTTARHSAQPRPPAIPSDTLPSPAAMARTKTSDASASFSGELDSAPGVPADTYPGIVPPSQKVVSALSFDDVQETSQGTDSFSDLAQGDSYTDAERLAPTKAPTSFSDEDQLGAPSDSFPPAEQSFGSAPSFSDDDQRERAFSQFPDAETQEKSIPPAPLPTPGRPVPPAPHNARTMIAVAPPSPANAPTMIAPPPAARRPRLSSDFDEPPPASTARGIQPVPASGPNVPPPFPPQPGFPTAYGATSPSPAATAPGAGVPPALPRMPGGQPMPGGMPMPGAVPIVPAPAPRTPVVLDVTPRGLGIATVAGYCEELIRRNSRLPAAQKKLFTTSRDRQDLVRIVVCQGESRRMDNNMIIGDLILSNLPPRPRGETSIEVTFSLDVSGILQVCARDAQTGREQMASLDLVGGMQQQDVAASRDRIAALRR